MDLELLEANRVAAGIEDHGQRIVTDDAKSEALFVKLATPSGIRGRDKPDHLCRAQW
jgi:hypothetical protein